MLDFFYCTLRLVEEEYAFVYPRNSLFNGEVFIARVILLDVVLIHLLLRASVHH